MSVIDKDLGWERIQKELKILDGSFTKVGLQQGEKHKNPESGEISDLVTIGAVHEFGTRNTPQRSWLRTAYDKNLAQINRVKRKIFGEVLDGGISPKSGLRLLGEFFEAKVKKNIVDLRNPPNSPATIARKKSSNPLIDTGQMLQSVRHVEVIQ